MNFSTLQVTHPAPREAWQDLVIRDPTALLFQTPEWMDCICASGSFKNESRLYEFSNGQSLVLPIARYTHLAAALAMDASLPHGWGMGGLVGPAANNPEAVAAVFADLARRKDYQTSVRPSPLQSGLWSQNAPAGVHRTSRSTHILDLSAGFDHIWTNVFSGPTRTKIRKAEKSGLILECDSTGRLLPDFYQTYLSWIDQRAEERRVPRPIARALGKWREPYKKFETVARTLGGSFQTWVAWLYGKPAAASILLIYREHAFYWRNASNRELAASSRANDLLQRHMIEAACNAGCQYYHMGESGGLDSLVNFKERFGAVKFPYEEFSMGHLPITTLQGWFGGMVRKMEKRTMQHGETNS